MIKPTAIALLVLLSAAGDWQTRSTEHFTIQYQERSADLVRSLEPRLEPELARICRALDAKPPAAVNLVVAPDQRTFNDMQGGWVSPYVSGMAYPSRMAIVVRPLSGGEVRHSSIKSVVSHEISHLVLAEKLQGHEPPLWLNEGLAVYMGEEPWFSRSERLLPLAMSGRALRFRHLNDSFPEDEEGSAMAYAQSGDFVGFLLDEFGRDAFLGYLDRLAAGETPESALEAAFHANLDQLEAQWFAGARRRYGLIAVLSGGGFLWFLISVLFLVAYWRKRTETRRRRELERAYEVPYEVYRHDLDDDEPPPTLH